MVSSSAITPDVEVWPTAADVLAGRDPVWEWVLAHRHEIPRLDAR
jgi:C-terminal processing protease CtpA/Prc